MRKYQNSWLRVVFCCLFLLHTVNAQEWESSASTIKKDNTFILKVTTKTSGVENADTDDRVYIFLNGNQDLKRELDTEKNDLESNATDVFTFRFDYPMSKVHNILLRFRGGDAWLCENISFQFIRGEAVKTYDFKVHKWFSTDKADQKEINATTHELFPILDWQQIEGDDFILKVMTQTGLSKEAKSDDDMHLYINGEEAHKHVLDTFLDDFESGSSDVFFLPFDYPVSKIKYLLLRCDGDDAWLCENISFQLIRGNRKSKVYSFSQSTWFSQEKKPQLFASKSFPLTHEWQVRLSEEQKRAERKSIQQKIVNAKQQIRETKKQLRLAKKKLKAWLREAKELKKVAKDNIANATERQEKALQDRRNSQALRDSYMEEMQSASDARRRDIEESLKRKIKQLRENEKELQKANKSLREKKKALLDIEEKTRSLYQKVNALEEYIKELQELIDFLKRRIKNFD
ncbi:PLAT/LH2 domain-containing protein [Candidatus Uabimicrobium amorphum]|uniref:PLAT domain-containing protein n=1 Tax=Uabimicrobium amorphum TaxID=2596890 RepID=A0A5S9IMB6_UABAM|nr:PLAT/LH2 domain-containing protein [Candidatus Uabimicrobium amorphum]BBM84533.1 hypothetical protein UABAM_02894 [Candidatus Uabimicrobium amorphum]